MTRRVDRGMLALLPPLLAYMAFGVARVDAPVGLIGLLFDEPLAFALTSTVIAIGGSVLLFVPAIERRLAGVLVPSREADVRQRARIEAALARVGARADMDTRRLIVQVQDTEDLNAAAGAAHLLYVTRGALARLDDEFEALIAHELAHHRGLHPIGAAMILWLSLPGEALAAVFRALSRLVERVAGRIRLLAVIAQVLLLAWQVLVMWLYYVGQLLGAWASRVGEFAADRGAAGWGYGDDLVALYRTFDDEPPLRCSTGWRRPILRLRRASRGSKPSSTTSLPRPLVGAGCDPDDRAAPGHTGARRPPSPTVPYRSTIGRVGPCAVGWRTPVTRSLRKRCSTTPRTRRGTEPQGPACTEFTPQSGSATGFGLRTRRSPQ